MKNTIIIIYLNLLFTLAVLANRPEYKITNPNLSVTNKVEQKKSDANTFQKEKIDITVKKDNKFTDKSVNWTGKRQKIDNTKSPNNKKLPTKNEKASQDFHEWANKTQDAIDLRMKQKDPKYQSPNPFSKITTPSTSY